MTWTGRVIAGTADTMRSTSRRAGPPRAPPVPSGPADTEGCLMKWQRLRRLAVFVRLRSILLARDCCTSWPSAVAAVTFAGPGSCGPGRAGDPTASSLSGMNVGSLLGTGRLESLARRRSLSSWNSNPRSAEVFYCAPTPRAGAYGSGGSAGRCQRWHATSRSGFAGREECSQCLNGAGHDEADPGCRLVSASGCCAQLRCVAADATLCGEAVARHCAGPMGTGRAPQVPWDADTWTPLPCRNHSGSGDSTTGPHRHSGEYCLGIDATAGAGPHGPRGHSGEHYIGLMVDKLDMLEEGRMGLAGIQASGMIARRRVLSGDFLFLGHRQYNHGCTDVSGHPSLRGHAAASQNAVPGYPPIRGVTAAGHQWESTTLEALFKHACDATGRRHREQADPACYRARSS